MDMKNGCESSRTLQAYTRIYPIIHMHIFECIYLIMHILLLCLYYYYANTIQILDIYLIMNILLL